MCIIAKRILISEKETIVWKIERKWIKNENGEEITDSEYCSLCVGYKPIYDKCITAEESPFKELLFEIGVLAHGYFHAYYNKEHAFKKLDRYEKLFGDRFKLRLIKCIIPKGETIFIGPNDEDCCAKRIIHTQEEIN